MSTRIFAFSLAVIPQTAINLQLLAQAAYAIRDKIQSYQLLLL